MALFYGNYDPKIIENKPYVHMEDTAATRRLLKNIRDYNSMSSKPMSLVYLKMSLSMSATSRIINQPYGNAMLVGVEENARA